MGRLANVMPGLVEVFSRFPVPALCCVIAFVVNSTNPFDFFRGLGEPLTLGLIAAFFAAGAAQLFAESRKWPLRPAVLLAAAAAGAAGALAFAPGLFESHEPYLILGLVLLLFVAPFLRRSATQGAVWLFGIRLALAALLAIVVGLTLMLGLLAIVSTLKFLLGIDLGKVASTLTYALSILLVGPLFGLALVPRNLDEGISLAEQRGGLLERGVSIFVNYVCVPLALIFALLLHVYAAKIIGLQSMPKGEVGLTVTLFTIAGTFAWLVAWPFRDTGTRLLKLYSRFWFWFLPVPVVLLALAVWQRVNAHGMTPDRYGLVLVALWAALVCIYLMLRRGFADMRVVLGGAAVLLLLGSFGPIGAVSTTIKSQFARFEKFLADNAMLENGKLKAALPALNMDKKKEGYDFLAILAKTNALGKAQSFLPAGEKLELNGRYVSDAVSERFGVKEYWQDAPQIGFNANYSPFSFPFAGEGNVFGPFQYAPWNLTNTPASGYPKYSRTNNVVTMTWAGVKDDSQLTLNIDEKAILKDISELKPPPAGSVQQPMNFAVDEKTFLIITEGSGQYSDAKAELRLLSFWVVVRK